MDVDEILRNLNPWGRYQILLLLVVCVYGTIAPALHILAFIYIMDTPIHSCKPYEGYSKSEAIPVSKFHSKDIVEYESCSIYRMQNGTLTNETMSCPDGIEYELSEGESTVVNEFGLVCDKKLMVSTGLSIYFCGVLVGSIIAGLTSDYFGRKKVFLTATFLIGVTGVGLTFTTSYYAFVAVWFITAIEEQCINVPSYVLLMEMFPPEKRTIAGCISNMTWGGGIALLPMYAYFLRDWRHMQIAISAPCLTAALLWCFIYESPRWMVSKGRLAEADTIFQKIGKRNKSERKITYINEQYPTSSLDKLEHLDETQSNGKSRITEWFNKSRKLFTLAETGDIHDLNTKKEEKKNERTYTMIDILRSPRMRRSTLVTYYVFLVNSLVYYGMSLNSSELYGDKYLNTFLVCLVDLPSGFITIFLMQRYNRRPLLSLFLLLAAVFSLISAFTPLTTKNGTNLYPLILTSACLGKYSIGSSFGIVWLYGNEIFPTELRNTGFGTCSFAARLGSITAPYFLYLNTFYDGSALLCFGVIAAIGGISVYLLPETRNKPLPETMSEGETLHAGREITRI